MKKPEKTHGSPSNYDMVRIITGPVLKFQTYSVKAFWMMLLIGFGILLLIRDQLKFTNGTPQNLISSFWFIYLIILAGVLLVIIFTSFFALIYVRMKLSMTRKYLQIHGKTGVAKIIQLRLLMPTSPLSLRSNYMVELELEFDHHRVHTLGYLGISVAHQIPKTGDSIKVYYDPDHVESVVLKDSLIQQKWL